jgi:replication initiation and membrane attachment protein DnaB
MKIKLLSAFALALILASSCSQKDDNAAKIQALEDKIAQMQTSNTAVAPVNAQSATNADPSSLGLFEFAEMEYDFGTIKEGVVVEHVFDFTNNGQAPLVISNITASCGCTSPDWTKTPINPGEKGMVKVVFNSTAKTGAQAPTVTIQANTNPTVTRLRMKGSVTPKSVGGAAPAGPLKR